MGQDMSPHEYTSRTLQEHERRSSKITKNPEGIKTHCKNQLLRCHKARVSSYPNMVIASQAGHSTRYHSNSKEISSKFGNFWEYKSPCDRAPSFTRTIQIDTSNHASSIKSGSPHCLLTSTCSIDSKHTSVLSIPEPKPGPEPTAD